MKNSVSLRVNRWYKCSFSHTAKTQTVGYGEPIPVLPGQAGSLDVRWQNEWLGVQAQITKARMMAKALFDSLVELVTRTATRKQKRRVFQRIHMPTTRLSALLQGAILNLGPQALVEFRIRIVKPKRTFSPNFSCGIKRSG